MASRLHNYAFKRVLKIIGIVILSLVSVFGMGLLFVRLFSLERVEVDGSGVTIEIDKAKLGENLLVVPVDRLTKELLESYPLLSSVRFEKRLPGTLIIHLSKRQPSLYITTAGNTYALDLDGVVLDNATNTNGFPLMIFDVGPLSIGSRISDVRVVSTLTFLKKLSGSLGISRINERDSASIQAMMGNTVIILPQKGDMGAKADTLQTIVEGFRIKGILPTVIDLRFEKPIITN